MKRNRWIKGLVVIFLFLALVLVTGPQTMNAAKQELQISLVYPPAIRKAAAFPIVAVVTNLQENAKLLLKKASWYWADKELSGVLTEELGPAGKAREIIEEIKNKNNKGAITKEELAIVKVQAEKLRLSTCYLRFPVSQDMVEELKIKNRVKVELKLTGSNQGDLKEISGLAEAVLKFDDRQLARPEVAPGAHHSDWYFGDTHSHSTYSQDAAGLGSGIYTIPELKSAAQVAGLDWIVLTDHAYCLDSTKFTTQKSQVTSLSDSTFAYLYGEELSAAELENGVKAYNSCHMNGIMNNTFISCVVDIFRMPSSPDSQQAVNYLKLVDGLVIINHPNWGTGLIEPNNFSYNTYPYTHGETGIEIINSSWDGSDNGATTRWIDRRLLKGEKVFPFGGSDTESQNNLGNCYTVVYADYLTQPNIKANLAAGHHYATTFPGLAMWARKLGTTTWSWMGDDLTMGTGTAEIFISYTDTYDGLKIYIMKGKNGWTSEQQVYYNTVSAGSSTFYANISVEPGCYLRAYCVENNDSNYLAYTSPIWFK